MPCRAGFQRLTPIAVAAAALLLPVFSIRASEFVWVTVAGSTSEIRQGDTPVFFVTVTNDSSAPVKVIAVEEERELQRDFYRLVVTKAGEPVWRTESCDQALPWSRKSSLELAPHQAYSFTLSNYTWLFKTLKAGDYEVAVRYSQWQSRDQCYSTESNRVPLTVK